MSVDLEKLKREVAEAAKVAGTAPKTAYSEILREVIEPNHVTMAVFDQFMRTRSLNPGDQISRRVRKGRYRARTMVPGAQHLTDATTFNYQFTYNFDRLIAGTAMNIMELRSGELGTLDEIKRNIRADLTDETVARVFNLLTTIWSASNTPSNYIDATATGLTSTVLDTAIENTIETVGNVRAIVGTRKALLPLYTFAGYREYVLSDNTTYVALPLDPILQERFNTGRVTLYNGVRVVEMPQIIANSLPTITRRLVRDDIVMVIGEDAGEIINYGSPEDQEHLDTSKQPADWQYHVWQQWGLLVDRPEALTIIEVS